MTGAKKKKSANSKSKPPARKGARITHVVTRTGDDGTTALVGGRRVRKDDPRIEAYGTTDELQTCLALARDALQGVGAQLPAATASFFNLLQQHLIYIQNLLFTLNGELATRVADRWAGMPLIGADDILYLEKLAEACNKPLPPLKDFVLPGGNPAVTALHLCRVVTRRAERCLERLARREPVGEFARPFINRLSDLFFVLARRTAHELQARPGTAPEIIWTRNMPQPPLPK